MTDTITIDANSAQLDAENPYERTARVAAGLASFETMEPVRLPILTSLVQEMDILRTTASLLPASAPKNGMSIPLPSGVGKSTAARMFVASAAERAGVTIEKSPVLLVELDIDETVSLWSAILRAIGDPYWANGSPKNLQKRASKYLAQRKIELIIVDEFNHSVDRDQARFLMNTIKQILNAGIAPVVMMGTDEELKKLPKSDAFERRMVHAPLIGPLRWGNPDHELNWRGFLQGLDQAIVDLEILQGKSGLGRTKLAKALCEACSGVLGYAHWVVYDSLTDVLKRGDQTIDPLDLAVSVNRLFVKFGLFDRVNAVEGL